MGLNSCLHELAARYLVQLRRALVEEGIKCVRLRTISRAVVLYTHCGQCGQSKRIKSSVQTYVHEVQKYQSTVIQIWAITGQITNFCTHALDLHDGQGTRPDIRLKFHKYNPGLELISKLQVDLLTFTCRINS